jgi:hypothetical protein
MVDSYYTALFALMVILGGLSSRALAISIIGGLFLGWYYPKVDNLYIFFFVYMAGYLLANFRE